MRKVIFMLALIVLPGLLSAEEEMPVYRLGEVIVTATKTETYSGEVGSSVTVITSEELKEKGKRSVLEILRGIEGITVVQTGHLGGNTSTYIRGTKSGHALVMIDGIEVNDPMSTDRSYYDLTHLVTDDIERIEIVRGPQSTLYGSDAIGGVINIITKKGEGKSKIEASFEGGSYETFRETARVSGAGDRVDYSLVLSRVDSKGISRAEDGDEEDGYENTTVSGRVGFRVFNDANLDIILRYLDTKADIDDGAYDDDPNFIGKTESWISKAEFAQPITSWWNHRLSFSYLNTKRKHHDGLDNIGRTVDLVEMDSWYKGDNKKVEWQHNFPVTEIDTITGGVEYEVEGGSSSYCLGTYQDKINRKTVENKGYYIQNQLKLWECFFSTIGARIDDHQSFGTEDTYRVSLAYLIKQIGAKLKANWGTGFKAPTLFQLYSSYGNPLLKPDRSEGYDIGFEQGLFQDKLSLGLTYFHNKIKDMIDWDFAEWKYKNIGKAVTEGIEAGITLNLTEDLSAMLNYTYTETEDKKTGLELLRRPKNQGALSINWHFLDKGNLNLSLIYVGRRKDIDTTVYPSTRINLDSYTRVDLACSYGVTENLEIFGRIENLFDKDYQEVYGYATPGISAYGGVRVEI